MTADYGTNPIVYWRENVILRNELAGLVRARIGDNLDYLMTVTDFVARILRSDSCIATRSLASCGANSQVCRLDTFVENFGCSAISQAELLAFTTHAVRWLLVSLLGGVAVLHAQDPAQILNRYVQVTGGVDLYHRYNSLHLFYTVTHPDKTAENVDYFHTRDGQTLIETDSGSTTQEAGVSAGIAWKYSEPKGAQILSGKEAARLLAETKGFDEDDWHLRYPNVALLPNQSINAAPCHHLKLTRTDGSTLERFYEIKSGLLVREISTEFDDTGSEQPVTTDFQRYDTFFGLRRPVSLHVKSGSKTLDIQMNTVTYSAKPEAGVAEVPHAVVRAIVASRIKPGGLPGTLPKPLPNPLPNPVDLIDQFVAATGGLDHYQTIKTEMVKAEVTFAAENLKFPVVTYSAGIKRYSYADMPSLGKFESGDDGFTGWEKSVVMGPKLRPHSIASEFMGPEATQIMTWSQGAMNMETLSEDQVNGTPCYLVRLGAKGDDTPTACFDTKTSLLLRTSEKDQDGPVEQVFSDYRAVNGLMVCYRIETKIAGRTASIRIQNIAINQPVPAGIFDLPPDVKALKAKRDSAQPPVSPGAPTLKHPQPL